MAIFLDTNVLVRHFTQDNVELSPRATAFLTRVERGEIHARVTDTVVFETVFLLERHYRKSKQDIQEALLTILELTTIELPNKHRIGRAFEFYVGFNLSFADAFHIALMEDLGITEIASFDRGFDRVPGIRRIEPS